MWKDAPNNENAICAFIPGDKFPEDGDLSATVRTVRKSATYITQNQTIDVLPASPDRPADGQDAQYVICYLVNLTEEDKSTLLSHPLFCTPEGTIATFELDFIPNSHVGTWGKSCLTDDPAHVSNALHHKTKLLTIQTDRSSLSEKQLLISLEIPPVVFSEHSTDSMTVFRMNITPLLPPVLNILPQPSKSSLSR